MKKLALIIGLVLVSVVGYGQDMWNDSSIIITEGDEIEIIKNEIEERLNLKYINPFKVLYTIESVRDFTKTTEISLDIARNNESTTHYFTYFESFEKSKRTLHLLLDNPVHKHTNYTVVLEKYKDLYKITCYGF